jgi:CBS domain-containing protein
MHGAVRAAQLNAGQATRGEQIMQVKDVMTKDVSYVGPGNHVAQVARSMRDRNVGSILVAEGDKLIGIVTDRDIVVRGLADGADFSELSVRQVMSPKILYCREDQSAEEVLQNMAETGVRRMPVVSSAKRLVGMVSIGDLSTAADGKAGIALREIAGRP